MKNLLEMKEKIIRIYFSGEKYIIPFVKFFTAFILFEVISKQVGFDSRLKNVLLLIVLSLFSAFTPTCVTVLLAAGLSIGHVYFISPILAALVGAIFLLLYLLFVRVTPKYDLVLVLVPVFMLFKIPYVIPLFLGMTAGPLTMITAGCGVIVYYLFIAVKEVSTNIASETNDIMSLYKDVTDDLLHNKMMFLTIAIFAGIILVTYLVRRLKVNYSFEIAIVAGTLTGMIGFLIGNITINGSNHVFVVMLGAIAAGIIVYVIQFFRLSLDYTAVENLQFEDDDYYYYVRAVPKMKIAMKKRNVTKIHSKKEKEIEQKEEVEFIEDDF